MSVPPQALPRPATARVRTPADVVAPVIDEAAFTAVFQEHHRTCLRLARRLVRDEGLADEVVQEVFLSWWGTAGGAYCPDRGGLAAWLLTITRHKAVDAVRSSERQRRLAAAAGAVLPCELEQRPVEDVVWWELGAQSLLAAMPALSPAQREVLALAYVQGLTQAQIADKLGIPLGTVKSRTHTGMLRLRAAVGGTWTPTGPTSRPERTHTGHSSPDPQAGAADGTPRTATAAATPATAAATVAMGTAAVGTVAGPLRHDVDRCARALAEIAAEETGDERHTTRLISQAAALVESHGEAGLYGLVVALARLAPAGATPMQSA